jgi:hypothetical protein
MIFCFAARSPLVMQLDNASDHLRHFGIVQRRAAAHSIPRQQQLKRDIRIDAMPKQMAAQRSDRGIALALWNAFTHQPLPLAKRAPGANAERPQQPTRQRGRRNRQRAAVHPGIPLPPDAPTAARDVAAVATQIDALRQTDAVANEHAGMREKRWRPPPPVLASRQWHGT